MRLSRAPYCRPTRIYSANSRVRERTRGSVVSRSLSRIPHWERDYDRHVLRAGAREGLVSTLDPTRSASTVCGDQGSMALDAIQRSKRPGEVYYAHYISSSDLRKLTSISTSRVGW